jgi:hypothetical protein
VNGGCGIGTWPEPPPNDGSSDLRYSRRWEEENAVDASGCRSYCLDRQGGELWLRT